MKSAFPEAAILGYESLVPSMANSPEDRHVLAAGVFGKVDAIVTLNSRDFPSEILRKFGIRRLTPDEFLVDQWRLDPILVRRRVAEQAIDCKKDIDTHLRLLNRMVPDFAALVRVASKIG
jgi:hypothetical protein